MASDCRDNKNDAEILIESLELSDFGERCLQERARRFRQRWQIPLNLG